MRDREGKSEIERSEQHVQNWSFDEKFKVLATENLVFDPEGNTLNRMTQPTTPTDTQPVSVVEKAPTDGNNPSLTISNDDMVEARTQTITKIIGSKNYEKILYFNAGGDIIGVSAWSEV